MNVQIHIEDVETNLNELSLCSSEDNDSVIISVTNGSEMCTTRVKISDVRLGLRKLSVKE